METSRIAIYDNTIRTLTEYARPGSAPVTMAQRVQIARALEELGVDVIEAGFPIRSPLEAETVRGVSEACRSATVAALARCDTNDIDRAWACVKSASHPRLHLFQATQGMDPARYRHPFTPEQIIESALRGIRTARRHCDDVQFSAEDTTTLPIHFVRDLYREAAKAGATTVNVIDPPITTAELEEECLFAVQGHSRIRRVLKDLAHTLKTHCSNVSVHCYGPADVRINSPMISLSTAYASHAVEEGVRQITTSIRNSLAVDADGRSAITNLGEFFFYMNLVYRGKCTSGIRTENLQTAVKIIADMLPK